jgi:two-component sensor histidine kinase
VLLKEIHHRVKNNLQLISSLLSLQVRSRKGATVDQLVYEIQARIHSIALLHEMLYQSGDLVHVNFRKYIETLAQTIVRYFGMHSRVELVIEAEDIKLSLDGSIYCGLLFNELITNAMKHAFPGSRKGKISILARRLEDSSIFLSVADDGIGLPESLDMENATSLGLELVQSLATKLHGKLSIKREAGSEFQLRFLDRG